MIKAKLSRQRRSDRLLSATFQPVDDALKPIESDLATILQDVKAVALDAPGGCATRGRK